jgi:hypothetical protein
MDGRNAEIAGANFGRRVPEPHDILKGSHVGWTDTPEMQEQFPARAWMARLRQSERSFCLFQQLSANPPGNLLTKPGTR